MFVDTHAHLTDPSFDADRDDVIARARDAGVWYIVVPGTTLDDSRKAVALAEKHEGVFACVGIHPHEAGTVGEGTLSEIEELSRHPRVVAIGEIGLDYHYTFATPDAQRGVFRDQLAIARRRQLPVVIHSREALEETIAAAEQAAAATPAWRPLPDDTPSRFPRPHGVFHCFPGNAADAWRVVRAGFFVSLPGILTFKNPGQAIDVASGVSVEHLLLETDSPYLTPVPHRGKRNEPAHIPLIAARLAELQKLSVEDIGRTTSYGAYQLFGIGEPPAPRFTYALKDALYVNLTIRCNADCIFCDRKGEAVIKGYNLRIDREPSAAEVIAEIGDPLRYSEIVFCGYGEPTIRFDALKEVARWVKAGGGKTRLNTDGHGNIINKRNIVPELVGLIDAISISLNSPDPVEYGRLMRVDGERMFPAMVEFARESVRLLPRVVMTMVDLQEVDRVRAQQLVEKEIGATFIVRPFF
jgi:TatD DNase family protein